VRDERVDGTVDVVDDLLAAEAVGAPAPGGRDVGVGGARSVREVGGVEPPRHGVEGQGANLLHRLVRQARRRLPLSGETGRLDAGGEHTSEEDDCREDHAGRDDEFYKREAVLAGSGPGTLQQATPQAIPHT
jgi:hypothetical protein